MKVIVYGASGMVGRMKSVTSTEQIGRAMIALARHGRPDRILEPEDINAVR